MSLDVAQRPLGVKMVPVRTSELDLSGLVIGLFGGTVAVPFLDSFVENLVPLSWVLSYL